tara:strand:- start:758 stop:928 length:171 start_codon:yes stop_codon:yes gene_type:complete
MWKKRRMFRRAGQVANTQQSQVQNAANVLAQALELGPADTASEETEVEEPKVVTTD